MDFVFQDFHTAMAEGTGPLLGQTLSPELPHETLKIIWKSTNHHDAKGYIRRNLQAPTGYQRLSRDELDGWADVYLHYWKTLGEILAVQREIIAPGKPSWTRVYESWREMVSLLVRGYQNWGFESWTIPCLYVAGKYLRVFAIKADEERVASSDHQATQGAATFQDDFDPDMEAHQQLEDCARQLNKVFTLCLNDRTQNEQESRKWAVYGIINLLFKTYFKLNQAGLSRNVLRALDAYNSRGDMPELARFPTPQQVTFKYYEGVLHFLDENYEAAEKSLSRALDLCHKDAQRNKELILTYLIPCHLISSHTLPTEKLLEPYPRLQKLFLPLTRCIKKGDLYAFDRALKEGEEEFVKRRIYLTLERGHDTCLRNLFRKVFVAGGFEEDPAKPGAPSLRRTRIALEEFHAALNLSSHQQLDSDEVECQMANLIYKGMMKGYISREHQKVVLSKRGDAFPGTGV